MNIVFDLENQNIFPREWAAVLRSAAAFSFAPGPSAAVYLRHFDTHHVALLCKGLTWPASKTGRDTWINTHIPLVAEFPHGGFKHSGYGKDLSIYAVEEYTRIKHVMSSME